MFDPRRAIREFLPGLVVTLNTVLVVRVLELYTDQGPATTGNRLTLILYVVTPLISIISAVRDVSR